MKRYLIDKARIPTKLHFWNIFAYDAVTGLGRFCAHAQHPSVLQTQDDHDAEPCPGEWQLPTLRHQISRDHVIGALAMTHGWIIKSVGGVSSRFEYAFQMVTDDARVMEIHYERRSKKVFLIDRENGIHPLLLPDLVRPDASMIARLIAVSHALGKHAYDAKTRTDIWSALEPRRKSHVL